MSEASAQNETKPLRRRGSLVLLARSRDYLSRRVSTSNHGWQRKYKSPTPKSRSYLTPEGDVLFHPPPLRARDPEPLIDDAGEVVIVDSPREALSPSQASESLSNFEKVALRHTRSFYAFVDEKHDEFYSSEGILERAKLRHHPAVISEATRFFHLIAKGEQSIGKSRYINFNMSLQRALFDDYEPKSAKQMALQDWNHDSGQSHGHRIELEGFIDSMFELCDLWTDTVDGDEYAIFLKNLFKRVSAHRPLDKFKGAVAAVIAARAVKTKEQKQNDKSPRCRSSRHKEESDYRSSDEPSTSSDKTRRPESAPSSPPKKRPHANKSIVQAGGVRSNRARTPQGRHRVRPYLNGRSSMKVHITSLDTESSELPNIGVRQKDGSRVEAPFAFGGGYFVNQRPRQLMPSPIRTTTNTSMQHREYARRATRTRRRGSVQSTNVGWGRHVEDEDHKKNAEYLPDGNTDEGWEHELRGGGGRAYAVKATRRRSKLGAQTTIGDDVTSTRNGWRESRGSANGVKSGLKAPQHKQIIITSPINAMGTVGKALAAATALVHVEAPNQLWKKKSTLLPGKIKIAPIPSEPSCLGKSQSEQHRLSGAARRSSIRTTRTRRGSSRLATAGTSTLRF